MREIKSLADFQELVENVTDDKLVMVDFHAQWCGPCKNIAPKLEKMAETFTNVTFCKLDVDEVEEVVEQYGINAMPTFLFFKNGKKIAEVVGANENLVKETIEKHKD